MLEPLVTVKGLEIEIRGRKVTLLLTPFQPYCRQGENPEVLKLQIVEAFMKLDNNGSAAMVREKADGTLRVVGDSIWKDEVESRAIKATDLGKVGIYQDNQN